MLDILQPKITMSIQEFLAFERKEITIKEIKCNRKKHKKNLDEYLKSEYKKAIDKKSLAAIECFIVITLTMCENVIVYAGTKDVDPKVVNAMKKVDHGGWMLMFIFRKIAFWICLIMCLLEILKCVTQGDIKSVGKIVVKYMIVFGACYFMPVIFDFISMLFE